MGRVDCWWRDHRSRVMCGPAHIALNHLVALNTPTLCELPWFDGYTLYAFSTHFPTTVRCLAFFEGKTANMLIASRSTFMVACVPSAAVAGTMQPRWVQAADSAMIFPLSGSPSSPSSRMT